MQSRKIQLWALGMAGYNCKIEYIECTKKKKKKKKKKKNMCGFDIGTS